MSMTVHSNWKTTMIQCNKTNFICKLVNQTHSPTPESGTFCFLKNMFIPFCPYIQQLIPSFLKPSVNLLASALQHAQGHSFGKARAQQGSVGHFIRHHPVAMGGIQLTLWRWGHLQVVGERWERGCLALFSLRWDFKFQVMLEKMFSFGGFRGIEDTQERDVVFGMRAENCKIIHIHTWNKTKQYRST